MSTPTLILDQDSMHRVVTRVAHEIAERCDAATSVLVGVQRGGAILAARLAAALQAIWNQPVPCGSLDVALHRDDLNQHAAPAMHPTNIPFDLDGRTVVLVDDVLFTGRTTRAALDALNDFGRPSRVRLAVLIDRGHRELPIKADFVGKTVPTAATQRVNVQLHEFDGADQVTLDPIEPAGRQQSRP